MKIELDLNKKEVKIFKLAILNAINYTFSNNYIKVNKEGRALELMKLYKKINLRIKKCYNED